MSFRFDPAAKAILVPVTVVGPRASRALRCAVDTGSAQTVLPTLFLRQLGYDLSRPVGHTNLRGATGVTRAPVIRVSAVAALERVRTDLRVAAHDFPIGTTADGLFGLDFFRGLVLKLDFARGLASLFARRWWQFWR